ncbi:hypothetical protein [Kitasatospora sp. NPDC056800]|uniref:hypothetical protein n=1 Tax=Kitasatospora sp. NPDC056800 TaxID=3345948 RepID=UPI0036C49E22
MDVPVTVNTAPISQAVVGDALPEAGFSPTRATSGDRRIHQRDPAHHLRGPESPFRRCPDVSRKTPHGGFFVVVDVPFTVGDELLERSGQEFGALFTPILHFHAGKEGRNHLRLSCSSLSGEHLEEGLNRLATLFADRGVRLVDIRADPMPHCSSVSMDITAGS